MKYDEYEILPFFASKCCADVENRLISHVLKVLPKTEEEGTQPVIVS